MDGPTRDFPVDGQHRELQARLFSKLPTGLDHCHHRRSKPDWKLQDKAASEAVRREQAPWNQNNPWLSRIPNLNPIYHVWSMLEGKISKRTLFLGFLSCDRSENLLTACLDQRCSQREEKFDEVLIQHFPETAVFKANIQLKAIL